MAVFVGSSKNDALIGAASNDILVGGSGDDTLEGEAGNDLLLGGSGKDSLLGGEGDDTLNGGSGHDTMIGGLGADWILAGQGHDLLDGGDGDDTLDGGSNNDTLLGGDGHDDLNGGSGNDSLEGGKGKDRLDGGSQHDTLLGGGGSDQLDGGSGNDELFGQGGKDLLEGGSGDDTLSGGGNDDTLIGGSGKDELLGKNGDDLLQGDSGDDTLDGGNGEDTLIGGEDDDVMEGGADGDLFHIIGDAGDDTINDFDPGEGDHLLFEDLSEGDLSITVDGGDTIVSFVDGPTQTLVGFDAGLEKGTVFFQGFEADTLGWEDETTTWSGNVTRVASGTDGIASADGSWHATFTQTDAAGGLTGPFTRFDGYRDEWPGEWCTKTDIYLDTGWAAGEGFDFSVASNGSDGAHQRDFIFHVTKDTSTGDLLVGGSNNTNFDPREDLETINHYDVDASGWYTFEHRFYDAGDGTLAVDLNLYDDAGTLLFTETRNDTSDVLATDIGANRYGWFTNIDIAGGIEVDNTELLIPGEGTADWYSFV